jgi:hypothetical protein
MCRNNYDPLSVRTIALFPNVDHFEGTATILMHLPDRGWIQRKNRPDLKNERGKKMKDGVGSLQEFIELAAEAIEKLTPEQKEEFRKGVTEQVDKRAKELEAKQKALKGGRGIGPSE